MLVKLMIKAIVMDVQKERSDKSILNSTEKSVKVLPEVSSFELTEEECLSKLQVVLKNDDDKPLSAKDVRDAWSNYCKFVMEPAGWQAVLIPSEDTADVLQGEAGRKGAVLVEVTDIVCDNLEAEVELLHECMENKIVSVPLDELFPIKKQEYEGLNMTSTIVALDLLRFFYKHIWMPWDEDSECLDWPAQHLENRLHLHFSLVTGTGDQATAIRLDHLMARAEHNRTALMDLEDLASLAEESNVENGVSYQMLGKMYELHQDQENIRREADMLEDSTLRMAVIKKTASARHEARKDKTSGVLMVWNGGHGDMVSNMSKIMTQLVTEFGDQTNIVMYPDLQHAIDCCVLGDTVIICSPGQHQLRGLAGLSAGGRILTRGCCSSSVTLCPGDTSTAFLNLESGKLEISDLTIDCKNVNIGLMTTESELTLKNVTVLGGSTALLVGQWGKLNTTNCKFHGAGIGVEVSAGGLSNLENTSIVMSRIGISIADGGKMSIKNSKIVKNTEYGLVIHCGKNNEFEGVWRGETGVNKAAKFGVNIILSEMSQNCLGDVAVLELVTQLPTPNISPFLEKRSHLARRFSTPMSGKSQMGHMDSKDSPIFNTLSRVLTYQDS